VYEYETLKSVKVIPLWRKRENNRGEEPNWGTIYVYVEISQQNPLYNYYIPIKMF
jgi:hypothetical protein